MKVYHQNGTMSEREYFIDNIDSFEIQHDPTNTLELFFYPRDNLIRDLDLELSHLLFKVVTLYFSDLNLYFKESSLLPVGLLRGGQNSDITISNNEFINLVKQLSSTVTNLYCHIYVGDYQYLISTVQNLLLSVEHCYIQYFMQIAEIECPQRELNETIIVGSPQTRQLQFYLETFFIKLYSIMDLMVKITYELENPIENFSGLTKLKSNGKLWGDKNKLRINKCKDTLFENCETIKMIESLRNEVVHNTSWEFFPNVFLKYKNYQIVERYMMFPDFQEGRLSSAKNRKHFFSKNIKVNEKLVLIHDEFYQRLLVTLRLIISNINSKNKSTS